MVFEIIKALVFGAIYFTLSHALYAAYSDIANDKRQSKSQHKNSFFDYFASFFLIAGCIASALFGAFAFYQCMSSIS